MKGSLLAIVAAGAVLGSVSAADLWTHELPVQGSKPDSKRWRDVVGRKVAVEGVA